MENSPINQSEEDKAAAKAELDDDDDDEIEEKAEKKSAPRHAPGITFEAIKPESKEKGEKPRVSITDRLLERIGAKPEEDTETTDEAEEKKTKVVSETEEEAALPVTNDTLEAASWDTEDASDSPEEPAVRPTSGEVAPDPSEEHEEFAEIPPAPEREGDEPEVEIGPIEPELLEEGLGSEGPPDPPEDEPLAGDAEDEPDPAPVTPSRRGGSSGGGGWGGSAPTGTWYDAAAADRARQKELEDAEYHGRREGTRKGVLTGLLFGWLIGRHGKKKQAKAHVKELKSKDKEIQTLKTEQSAATERLNALKRTQEQLSSDTQHNTAEPTVSPENTPKRPVESLEPAVISTKSVEKQLVSKAVEVLPLKTVGSYEQSPVKSFSAEKAPKSTEIAVVSAALTALERSTSAVKSKEMAERNLEKAPEDQEITEKEFQVADGRRVETSAWHRIEIDEKTGKPVENPEVAYGEEFRREQREVLKQGVTSADDTKEVNPNEGLKTEETFEPAQSHYKKNKEKSASTAYASVGSAAQIGGLAAASFVKDDQTYADAKASESGLAGMPLGPVPEHHLKNAGLLRFASNPVVWVIAALIVVVLFVLGILR